MIPILYESNEVAFASNGLCRLPDCISAVVTEERNGVFEVEFDYPVDGLHFDMIQPGRIISCTHDDTGAPQPFDIVGYSRPINGVVTFHGVHISYRQGGMTVSGKNINSLADALTLFASANPSPNPFTYETDKTSTAYFAAADGEPRTVRQMLGGVEGSILDTYGGEFEWDKFRVILHSTRGVIRDFTIRYGLNMTEYQEEADYTETYSAVIPFWRGDNGKGSEVIVKGAVTDSGVTPYSGRQIVMPMDLSDKFETKPTAAQLQTLAASMLSSGQPYLPSQSITVKFADLVKAGEYGDLAPLMSCRLCDTIGVVFPRYNMSGRFKIVKTVYNVLLERYEEMELGALSTTLADAMGVSGGTLGSSYSLEVQELHPTYTRTSGTPASGVEITGQRWGQVVELHLGFTLYTTAAGGYMAGGTIGNVPAPISAHVRAMGQSGTTLCLFDMIPSLDCSVRVNAAVSTSTSHVYFDVVYITND